MYLILALILLSIVLTARMASKWRLPLVVIALGMGIVFGSDVTGLIYFDNATMARQLADLALIFVLFAGGFGTRKELLKTVFWPSMTSATLGVVITAIVTGLLLHLILHYDLTHSFLLGCIISSTDAAAVFSILRSRSLSPRLSAMTEIESASNDPMAIILTTFAVQLMLSSTQQPFGIGLSFLWQLAGGILIGLLLGKLGVYLCHRVKTLDKGYFYIFLIGIILLSYGLATSLSSSGMMSAFFAGFVMGNSSMPYKKTFSSFLDALSTIANVGIFVLLGLLVFPKEFGSIWIDGLVLFLVLTFVARPVAVFACTFFGKFSFKEQIVMSWGGLRGAVPIVLATYPVAAGIEASKDTFNIIFFAVTLSMLIQGTTIGKIAAYLKLTTKNKPRPSQTMELVTIHSNELELCEITIDDDLYEGSTKIADLQLPAGTTITMINRNDRIIAPQGSTKLLAGDVLYILVSSSNIDIVSAEILGKFTEKAVEAK
ncbi:MAG: potassium/proton antiporter [Fibrobacter sp.]|nr:potassium/proton antiporter [Fibrobacter sp.]